MTRLLNRIHIAADVELEVTSIVGARSHPVVAVLGGVHGDELEGIAAVRMLGARLASRLTAGQLRLVAVANPPAFAARTRRSPLDDADLARSFPGDHEGSVTERIAATLTSEVIRGADLLIDLHSAGSAYSMPFFAGARIGESEIDRRSEHAARVFGAPLLWLHDEIAPGRSLSAALDSGVAAIYAESGGGAALVRREVQGYVDGVERVLGAYGMIAEQRTPPDAIEVICGGDGDVGASVATPAGGWCITAVAAGDRVDTGDILAEIVDEAGAVVAQVTAPRAGTIMMLRRHAEVKAGEGIALIGPTPEAPS